MVEVHTVLDGAEWQRRRVAHERRAGELASGHEARRRQGLRHPVEDFLWTYYPLRPGRLRRWHAGIGTALLDAGPPGPGQVQVRTSAGPATTVDVPTWRETRSATLARVTGLLAGVAARPARHDCFGLHEWAMLYRPREHEPQRHDAPLRLGRGGTDAVVDRLPLRCTHYDAFRFFTEAAEPRNATTPDRARQAAEDQPGCVHVTMDLLKWCLQLGPLVPGELLLDCFALARDARVLDMRASPYDLAAHGCEPLAVETAEGRAAYAAAQRELTARAAPLRSRLLDVCRLAAGPSPHSA